MGTRVRKKNTRPLWARDVERLLAEAFGEVESDGVPEPTTEGDTKPYRFDNLVSGRRQAVDPADP